MQNALTAALNDYIAACQRWYHNIEIIRSGDDQVTRKEKQTKNKQANIELAQARTRLAHTVGQEKGTKKLVKLMFAERSDLSDKVLWFDELLQREATLCTSGSKLPVGDTWYDLVMEAQR